MSSNKEKILSITCGGVCLALAFVLSQIKLFEMPMGGTVSPASCLPIVVFGMAFGPLWGFAVSIIFSCLQLIGGWLVTPFQVLLDYILGYTMLGIAGFAGIKASDRYAIKNPLKRFRSANLALSCQASSSIPNMRLRQDSIMHGYIPWSTTAASLPWISESASQRSSSCTW